MMAFPISLELLTRAIGSAPYNLHFLFRLGAMAGSSVPRRSGSVSSGTDLETLRRAEEDSSGRADFIAQLPPPATGQPGAFVGSWPTDFLQQRGSTRRSSSRRSSSSRSRRRSRRGDSRPRRRGGGRTARSSSLRRRGERGRSPASVPSLFDEDSLRPPAGGNAEMRGGALELGPNSLNRPDDEFALPTLSFGTGSHPTLGAPPPSVIDVGGSQPGGLAAVLSAALQPPTPPALPQTGGANFAAAWRRCLSQDH